MFRCTSAYPLPIHRNLCTQCSSYKPEGIHECSTLILYLLIINLMEFLKYELSTIFTIYGIYQCIFSLDIFIWLSKASMVKTWIGLFCTLWGHRSERSGVFITHLDAAVQRVAGEYYLIGGWLPVSEVKERHWWHKWNVAPVHGALEEAEALASSYGFSLNSDRPLWQTKVVLYRYSGATGICQYPLLRSKVVTNLAGSRSLSLFSCPH